MAKPVYRLLQVKVLVRTARAIKLEAAKLGCAPGVVIDRLARSLPDPDVVDREAEK